MKTVPVSVIVPVKNEAANLRRCLASVSWADEIWVVDSQSTDSTIAIAEAAGAKVVQFQYNGSWPKKRQWALTNLPLRNEWVFLIDADETLHVLDKSAKAAPHLFAMGPLVRGLWYETTAIPEIVGHAAKLASSLL